MGENELFSSVGHANDEDHIALIEPPKFKIFDSKSEMDECDKEDDISYYFCRFDFNMTQKKLVSREPVEKKKMKPIQEGIECDDESENGREEKNMKKKSKKKKAR